MFRYILLLSKCRVSQIKFTHLEGCEVKRMQLIFKIKMLIYHSKANLDVEMFGNITHLIDREIK